MHTATKIGICRLSKLVTNEEYKWSKWHPGMRFLPAFLRAHLGGHPACSVGPDGESLLPVADSDKVIEDIPRVPERRL